MKTKAATPPEIMHRMLDIDNDEDQRTVEKEGQQHYSQRSPWPGPHRRRHRCPTASSDSCRGGRSAVVDGLNDPEAFGDIDAEADAAIDVPANASSDLLGAFADTPGIGPAVDSNRLGTAAGAGQRQVGSHGHTGAALARRRVLQTDGYDIPRDAYFEFTPSAVDGRKCLARIWNGGSGGHGGICEGNLPL